MFVRHAGAAARFRRHLRAAGVDRAALFERNETRLRIRVHDLRATFVTLGLASGRTETWIADRTGHRSSIEINKYRRAARSIAELGAGDLTPLDEAIPEIARALRDAEKTSEGSPRDSDTAPASPCGDSTQASTTDDVEPSGTQDPSPTMKTPATDGAAPGPCGRTNVHGGAARPRCPSSARPDEIGDRLDIATASHRLSVATTFVTHVTSSVTPLCTKRRKVAKGRPP